jgi:hypothetical protein
VVLVLTRRVSVCSYFLVVETLDNKDESCYGFELRRVFKLPHKSAVGSCRNLAEILEGERKLEQRIETQPSLLEMWKEWNKLIMQERRARAEAVRSIDLRRTC